jgi:hypothetical protein
MRHTFNIINNKIKNIGKTLFCIVEKHYKNAANYNYPRWF